eukprot:TRINITY_DN5100_c0_g1_i1.p1 TRINITY_DN5100_c0_g1~~TRINITY_DN5100_c0_g1_i1.p1  ORF type:complete len:211 (+),score=37.41 TRINITY_DN5100_c0_g1_i1:98-730(+)
MKDFFKKQEVDETGKLAVRVQRMLITLFIISIIELGLNIALLKLDSNGKAYPAFSGLIFGWALLFIGFMGAYRRSPGLLLVYCICVIVLLILGLIGCILLIMLVIAISEACEGSGCEGIGAEPLVSSPGRIAVVVLLTIFDIISLIVQIAAVVLALRLRRALRVSLPTYTVVHHVYEPPPFPQVVVVDPNQAYPAQPPVYAQYPQGTYPQ